MEVKELNNDQDSNKNDLKYDNNSNVKNIKINSVNPFPEESFAYKQFQYGQSPSLERVPYIWKSLSEKPTQEVMDAYPDLDWSICNDIDIDEDDTSLYMKDVLESENNASEEDAEEEVGKEVVEEEVVEEEDANDEKEDAEEEEVEEEDANDEEEEVEEEDAEEEEVVEEEVVEEEDANDEEEVEEEDAEEEVEEEEVEEEDANDEEKDVEEEEVVEEDEAEESDSDEELELEEIVINEIKYLTDDTVNGHIYKCDEDGEIIEDDDGELITVGKFNNKVSNLYF